jgi:Protein of unknown function (DUF3592)
MKNLPKRMHSSPYPAQPSLRANIGWWVTLLCAVIWGITMFISVTPRALNELDERQQLSRKGETAAGTVVAHKVQRGTRNCDSFTTVRYTVESKSYELQLNGGCNVQEQRVGTSIEVVYLKANPTIAQASVAGSATPNRFTRFRLFFLWLTVVYLALLSRYLWNTRLRSLNYWYLPSNDRWKWKRWVTKQGLIFDLFHIFVLVFGLFCLGGQATAQHFVYFIVFFCALLIVQYAKSEPCFSLSPT